MEGNNKVGALLRLGAEKSLSKFNCPKQDKLAEYQSSSAFHFRTAIQIKPQANMPPYSPFRVTKKENNRRFSHHIPLN